MKLNARMHGIFLFCLLGAFAGCNNSEPTDNKTTTTPDDLLETGEVVESAGFKVVLTDKNKGVFSIHRSTGWADACVADATNKDAYCYIEGEELDLHYQGLEYRFNIPKSECAYVFHYPYFYYNSKTANGPTEFEVYKGLDGTSGYDSNLDGIVTCDGIDSDRLNGVNLALNPGRDNNGDGDFTDTGTDNNADGDLLDTTCAIGNNTDMNGDGDCADTVCEDNSAPLDGDCLDAGDFPPDNQPDLAADIMPDFPADVPCVAKVDGVNYVAGTSKGSYLNETAECIYDYSGDTPAGANCCLGTYDVIKWEWTGEIGTGYYKKTTAYDEEWGGKAGDCLAGPAVDTQKKTLNGFPKNTAYYVEDEGLNETYLIEPPMDNNSTSSVQNVYIANYDADATADPEDPTQWIQAFFPTDVRVMGNGYASNPFYEIACYDRAFELQKRIRLLVREWNAETDFNARATTGNPDAAGFDSSPFGSHPLNDVLDWGDIGATGFPTD